MDIERAIEKLKSANSFHTQAQYDLDDETIEMAIAALEKQKLKKPTLNEIEKALAYLKDSVKYAEKYSNAKEVKNIINTAIQTLEKQKYFKNCKDCACLDSDYDGCNKFHIEVNPEDDGCTLYVGQ